MLIATYWTLTIRPTDMARRNGIPAARAMSAADLNSPFSIRQCMLG